MDMQPGVCVIDLFGMSYDGTLPSIVFACDEIWWTFCGCTAKSSQPRVCRSSGGAALSLSLKAVSVSSDASGDRSHLSVERLPTRQNGLRLGVRRQPNRTDHRS